MAEIKGIVDDNGVIYEGNKILPEKFKIKFFLEKMRQIFLPLNYLTIFFLVLQVKNIDKFRHCQLPLKIYLSRIIYIGMIKRHI